jgi:3-dehydroquinate synthase
MYSYLPRPNVRTEFVIGENIFTSSSLQEFVSNRRVLILADAGIAKKYGERLKKRLNAELISIAGGEKCKTREKKEELEDILLKKRFDRDTLMIGMGGGALTDLVGYLASTYLRGVPLIFIPTTLLGMVDASIGGKNGIDTPLGKNLIGTIYHPMAVYIDPQLLTTLPAQEWLNGLAEVLKHGLIFDKWTWDFCEKHPLAWKTEQNLKELIRASILTKLHILEEDVDEKGIRRILNFGHTVGHGLEVLSQYRMAHGEAVAIGSMAESWLSWHLGHLSQKALDRILSVYQQCGFKVRLPKNFSEESLAQALLLDKKSADGQPRYVMLERIGHTIPFHGAYCAPIEPAAFHAMVSWMKKQSA